eukprot:scaffold27830_cov102-Isochrysis_galbana.AAC.2
MTELKSDEPQSGDESLSPSRKSAYLAPEGAVSASAGMMSHDAVGDASAHGAGARAARDGGAAIPCAVARKRLHARRPGSRPAPLSHGLEAPGQRRRLRIHSLGKRPIPAPQPGRPCDGVAEHKHQLGVRSKQRGKPQRRLRRVKVRGRPVNANVQTPLRYRPPPQVPVGAQRVLCLAVGELDGALAP